MSRALLLLACWMTFAVITLHDTVVVDSTRTGKLFAQENNAAAEVDSPQALNESNSQNRLGRIIRIRTPITGSDDIRIKRAIEQLLDNLPRNVATENRPVLVLEFVPPLGGDGSGSEFERCLALASFLQSEARLNAVRTVAYVPKTLIGHAVLVALACEEIIITEDAQFGQAGVGERGGIAQTKRRGYVEIAEGRNTVPAAVAIGMLDQNVQVYQVRTSTGTVFALADDLDELRSQRTVISADTIIPAGEMGLFRGDVMRELGFASYLANDRTQLATALGIPASNLEFDPSMGGEWQAIRVALDGPVNAQAVDRVISAIDQRQAAQPLNLVCIEINSPGGDILQSLQLANFLADLDRSTIRTVAYIENEALADAALVAFACDHVVAKTNASIGGDGAQSISTQQLADVRLPIQEIGYKKDKTWSTVMAMLDAETQVFRYSREGSDVITYMSPEECQLREDSDAWVQGESITLPDRTLQLTGETAEQQGFVRFQVDNFNELMQLYSLEDMPELVKPNWAFEIIQALARPQVAGILLFIGIFAMYIELSSPGIGLGGIVATICFVLYFWANFLSGTAEVLEIMLFLTGMIFIAIEIFVIPGFGVFGLGGGGLVLASLILASQTFIIPTNEYQMNQLPKSVFTVLGAFLAGAVALGFLSKHLHHTPILGKVMLPPPHSQDETLAQREATAHFQHLLGEVGHATTRLVPSGKAMFGDELVNVITGGEMIDKGATVQVIEVVGNRIIVEEANLT